MKINVQNFGGEWRRLHYLHFFFLLSHLCIIIILRLEVRAKLEESILFYVYQTFQRADLCAVENIADLQRLK